MKRRISFLAALVCLTALALAVAPWTVSSTVLTGTVAKQLRAAYGVTFEVAGRTTIAFLPVPRVKFEGIALDTPEGNHLVRGGQLRGELRLLPLLLGRIEIDRVALNGSRIDIEIDADGRSPWDRTVAGLHRQAASDKPAGRAIERLIITNSDAVLTDRRRGFETVLRDINIVANWPGGREVLEIGGTLGWRGDPVQIALTDLQPGALVAGGSSPVAIRLTSPLGRLSLTGTADSGAARLTGRAGFETRSLRDFARWTGTEFPFAGLIEAVGLEGDFVAERKGLSWPAVRMTLGTDRLDGALSARVDAGRLALTGTLAADRLNLTGLFAPFAQLRSVHGPWSSEHLDLGALTGADLDLRLSASSGRVGSLRFEDLALNVLVKPGRIETAVGRATVERGVVKGRLGLSSSAAGIDMKVQGAFDRMDLGALLDDLGYTRWLTGTAQGQVAFEAVGESVADLVRRLHGRAGMTIRQGELIGVNFADVLRKIERRPLSAEWKGGRTPFESAQLVVSVANGVSDVLEATMTAPSLRAVLIGRLGLVERTVSAIANFEAVATGAMPPSPSLAFEISGTWDDVSIAPDARALIQRSGAARPLLAPAAPVNSIRRPAAIPRPTDQ